MGISKEKIRFKGTSFFQREGPTDKFLRVIWSQGLFFKTVWGKNSFQRKARPLPTTLGSRDGAVVRALASHQCGPGSTPGLGVICGLSLLLVLVFAPRGFFSGYFGFPLSPKNNISKLQLDLDYGEALYHEPLAREIAQALPVFSTLNKSLYFLRYFQGLPREKPTYVFKAYW